MARTGRPTKLDREAANEIVAVLERGLPICDACEAAGISKRAFENWIKRGQKAADKEERTGEPAPAAESEFVHFFRAQKKARTVGKISLVEIIRKRANEASPTAWIAAAWLLERMHPTEFGRRTIRIEHSQGAGEEAGKAPLPPIVEIICEEVGPGK